MVTLTNIPGTSATNTITFNGNGNTVIWQPGNGNRCRNKTEWRPICPVQQLKIENLATNAAGSGVLLINNASNNIFTGCTINNSITSTATSVWY